MANNLSKVSEGRKQGYMRTIIKIGTTYQCGTISNPIYIFLFFFFFFPFFLRDWRLPFGRYFLFKLDFLQYPFLIFPNDSTIKVQRIGWAYVSFEFVLNICNEKNDPFRKSVFKKRKKEKEIILIHISLFRGRGRIV